MGARSEISETITLEKNILVREVVAGRFGAVSKATALADSYETPADLWDAGELRSSDIDLPRGSGEGIVFADIFCGAGGLSQGVHDACMALGVRNQCAFGADQDQEALAIFSENLKPAVTLNRNISHLVDYLVDGQADSAHFAYPPSLIESRLDAWRHKVTLLVGGPPCQGHSNLNNKTRREDPRNLHYLSVPALAIALNVRAVVIENVPDVRQDKASVFSTASALLKSEGFHVDSILMNAVNLGIPQTRKRLFLVATKGRPLKLQAAYEACARGIRPLSFAINDLETIKSENVFDSTANIDAVSQSRIDYLFDHSLYELPNEMRPDCHRDGHSYPSVYGRLNENLPSGTITQGFNTIGRGRFIHPTQRRPISPHEAARIQGFSDRFKWLLKDGASLPRSTYAKLIGNAVPPKMGYAVMLAILESLFPKDSEQELKAGLTPRQPLSHQ